MDITRVRQERGDRLAGVDDAAAAHADDHVAIPRARLLDAREHRLDRWLARDAEFTDGKILYPQLRDGAGSARAGAAFHEQGALAQRPGGGGQLFQRARAEEDARGGGELKVHA